MLHGNCNGEHAQRSCQVGTLRTGLKEILQGKNLSQETCTPENCSFRTRFLLECQLDLYVKMFEEDGSFPCSIEAMLLCIFAYPFLLFWPYPPEGMNKLAEEYSKKVAQVSALNKWRDAFQGIPAASAE